MPVVAEASRRAGRVGGTFRSAPRRVVLSRWAAGCELGLGCWDGRRGQVGRQSGLTTAPRDVQSVRLRPVCGTKVAPASAPEEA